ncbi:hypothetical protein MTY59_35040 [Mycobacterium senriense]|uniref:Uncharacterized protein n=1 Tax=Mycobacterium senriense TaxID=2775496 RepID=A0ABN6IN69_9MYCO|nr:hypothetical protein MTY59_35040 [Mycobacterium senriense]
MFGGRVIAHRADELHLRARARCRHRLIAALAAGRLGQRRRQNRFARPRKGVDTQRQIEIHAAHYTNPSHDGDVSRDGMAKHTRGTGTFDAESRHGKRRITRYPRDILLR